MADTTYTIVGMSGSGKTCYITAMYMKMAAGFDGFTLVTDDQTRSRLERDIRTLREPRGMERFPVATNATAVTSYDFDLCYETDKLITFEIMDYAGGLLSTREDTYKQFKDSLAASSAMYIFIDGKSLCTNDREERRENLYYDCAMTMTPIIQDFANANGYIPPIVFVVTKADLCKNYIDQQEIIMLLRDLFSPAFSRGTYTYLCAISLGDTISDDGYKGRFSPTNVHLPFFIGAYHDYYDMCVSCINKLEKSYESKKSADFYEKYTRIASKIPFFGISALICRKDSKNAVKEANDEISSLESFLKYSKAVFSLLGERLRIESKNFTCFIDGAEQMEFRGIV